MLYVCGGRTRLKQGCQTFIRYNEDIGYSNYCKLYDFTFGIHVGLLYCRNPAFWLQHSNRPKRSFVLILLSLLFRCGACICNKSLSNRRDCNTAPCSLLIEIIVRCPTTYDVTSADKAAQNRKSLGNCFFLLLGKGSGCPLYRHNTHLLSLFAQRRRRISAHAMYR